MATTPREIEVTLPNGVQGTIAIPPAADLDNHQALDAPPTHKMAVLLHGQGGHRDYCYQKTVAHRLATDLGIYSLRIDFRGCGGSADNADPKKGRLLSQDMDDIDECVRFVTDAQRNPLDMAFTVSSIIAHSRGGVAMFLWALRENERLLAGSPAVVVPNLINCLSRFDSKTIADRYPIHEPDFDGMFQTILRHGKHQSIHMPKPEFLDLASPNLSSLRGLSRDFSVLSIYGLLDHVVPQDDCAKYANVLNRGPYTHHLEVIPGADHNFFGVNAVESDADAKEYNPRNLPLNRHKLPNYNGLVSDMIVDFLRPENELRRFAAAATDIGRVPRWKRVDGVSNFRDVGGWKVSRPTFPELSPPGPRYYVKPGLLFRCANTADLTEKGAKALGRLQVRVLFDLRSEGECAKDGTPQHLEKYGIKRVHAPVFTKQDYSPQAIALRYSNLMTSWATYVHVYENMLEYGAALFRQIMEYIRDGDGALLFHCTAGKDRTGVLSMLILMLVGVDYHTIAKEYELTTLGLRPDHARIKTAFVLAIEKMKSKMEDTSALEEMMAQGRKNWTIENDGFANLISLRYEAMLATIDLLNTKYGGILPYFRDILGFSDADIFKIYNKIVIKRGDDEDSETIDWEQYDRAKF